MQTTSLPTVVRDLLETAREASAGRAAATVYGGQRRDLRQTVIALAVGTRLGEHDSPGEATIQVLQGEVVLHAGELTWHGATGDHTAIPAQRHDLEATTDAAVMLTVATRA